MKTKMYWHALQSTYWWNKLCSSICHWKSSRSLKQNKCRVFITNVLPVLVGRGGVEWFVCSCLDFQAHTMPKMLFICTGYLINSATSLPSVAKKQGSGHCTVAKFQIFVLEFWQIWLKLYVPCASDKCNSTNYLSAVNIAAWRPLSTTVVLKL